MLQQNQTAGRRLPSDGTWSFGRAWLGQAQTWQAMFTDGELEWNASRLVAPADFHVLGYNTSGKSGQGMSLQGYRHLSQHLQFVTLMKQRSRQEGQGGAHGFQT